VYVCVLSQIPFARTLFFNLVVLVRLRGLAARAARWRAEEVDSNFDLRHERSDHPNQGALKFAWGLATEPVRKLQKLPHVRELVANVVGTNFNVLDERTFALECAIDVSG
jgi:hypothetical protein